MCQVRWLMCLHKRLCPNGETSTPFRDIDAANFAMACRRTSSCGMSPKGPSALTMRIHQMDSPSTQGWMGQIRQVVCGPAGVGYGGNDGRPC